MSLQTSGKIVKAHVITDFALYQPAWKVLDLVGQLIPLAVKLLRGSSRGRLDRMALNDQRIEIDHLDMIVECL